MTDLENRNDVFAPLRLKNFRRFLLANCILIIGQRIQVVAVGWEVYEKTGSAVHLGYVGLTQFLPVLLFSLFSGHIVDSFNRKTILVISLTATSIAAAVLAWNSGENLTVTYATLFLTGTIKCFQNPARTSLLPRIVPKHLFVLTVRWITTSFQISLMAGPALGGLMIGIFHVATYAYLTNCIGALIVIGLILSLRYQRLYLPRQPFTREALLAGFTFVKSTKVILATMILDAFAVLLGGATALMPIYAKDILQVGPSGLGWLLAAPSFGSLLMAIFQVTRKPRPKAGRAMLLSLIGFGSMTIVFGISTNFWLSLTCLFILGMCDNISVIVRQTLIQVLTPEDMRGRVSALSGLFIGASNELGGFESGMVAGLFGPVFSVVSGGIGTLLVTTVIAKFYPQLKDYEIEK